MLAELAAREEQLLANVHAASGLIEQRHAELEQDGTYAAYQRVHHAYTRLLGDSAAHLEALKRALFLSWYEQIEPACFTGLWDLDAADTRQILHDVEARLAGGTLDRELEWMLPWYYDIVDYLFERSGLPLLQAFLTEADPLLWQRVGVTAEQFAERGQMGRYWSSLLPPA